MARLVVAFDPKQEAQQATADPGLPRFYRDTPPLRTAGLSGDALLEAMFAEDPATDAARVLYQRKLWHSQDALLRGRDRQVEENIRMLCGQHWMIWNELLGRYVDLSRYWTDEERRWRQTPVLNRLMLWFMLLHARMTENPPIITFQPSSTDRVDAELAETMDTVWKTLWRTAAMDESIDDLVAWLIPGGTAYLKSRIDPDAGELVPYTGPGVMRILGPDGQPIRGEDDLPLEQYLDKAPYNKQGEPLHATMDTMGNLIMPTPHMEYEGSLVVDALSALEVRSEWGPKKHRHKRWHHHRTYVTPEEVFNNFGVEVEPEVFGDEANAIAELQRLQFGSGYYGQAGGREETSGTSNAAKEGFVEIIEGWYRPCDFEGMERTEESAGGRLLITTRNRVLRDGPRYAPFPNTSPIHRFDFVNIPGRPNGTSPQEMMNGPARSRNRLVGQIFAHTDKVANPIKMIDRSTGLQPGDVPNKPGAEVFGNFNGQNGDPIRFTRPPELGRDVYSLYELLTREHDDLGNIPGAEGRPPTMDSSGELVKELRFNSDRFVAPVSRRMVLGLARVCEDWRVMLPIIWSEGKILRAGGDERMAQTIMAMPHIFEEGKINIIPDLESMLPEGRGEREERNWRWYQQGVFGAPGSPEANAMFLDMSHFPHLNRDALPGGVDRSTADEENGMLLQGELPPVMGWYDHQVHLAVHYRFMKTTRYLRLPIHVQELFVAHVTEHEEMLAAMEAEQMLREAEMQASIAAQFPALQPQNGGPNQPSQGNKKQGAQPNNPAASAA